MSLAALSPQESSLTKLWPNDWALGHLAVRLGGRELRAGEIGLRRTDDRSEGLQQRARSDVRGDWGGVVDDRGVNEPDGARGEDATAHAPRRSCC